MFLWGIAVPDGALIILTFSTLIGMSTLISTLWNRFLGSNLTNYCYPDPYEHTYLDSPEFYFQSLHVLAFFTFPIYIFGGYLIIFKTPKSMSSVKYTLLIFHFWTCFVDILFSFLVAPYLLAPLFAGFPMGILGRMGVGMDHQTALVITSTAAMYVSIMCVYENRFFILVLDKKSWKLFRVPWYMVNYLLACYSLFLMYPMAPDQAGAEEWILEKLPCLPLEIQSYPIFLITKNVLPLLISTMALCSFISIEAFYFCYLVKKALDQYGLLSRSTVELQKKFLKAVILQLIIPSIFLIFPLSWLVWSALLKIYSPMMTNFSFILVSTHGFFSTIFMIYIQRPYREVFIGYCVYLGRLVGVNLEKRKISVDINQSIFELRTSRIT